MDDIKIAQLLSMLTQFDGTQDVEEISAALRRTNNDLDLALEYILSSEPPPPRAPPPVPPASVGKAPAAVPAAPPPFRPPPAAAASAAALAPAAAGKAPASVPASKTSAGKRPLGSSSAAAGSSSANSIDIDADDEPQIISLPKKQKPAPTPLELAQKSLRALNTAFFNESLRTAATQRGACWLIWTKKYAELVAALLSGERELATGAGARLHAAAEPEWLLHAPPRLELGLDYKCMHLAQHELLSAWLEAEAPHHPSFAMGLPGHGSLGGVPPSSVQMPPLVLRCERDLYSRPADQLKETREREREHALDDAFKVVLGQRHSAPLPRVLECIEKRLSALKEALTATQASTLFAFGLAKLSSPGAAVAAPAQAPAAATGGVGVAASHGSSSSCGGGGGGSLGGSGGGSSCSGGDSSGSGAAAPPASSHSPNPLAPQTSPAALAALKRAAQFGDAAAQEALAGLAAEEAAAREHADADYARLLQQKELCA